MVEEMQVRDRSRSPVGFVRQTRHILALVWSAAPRDASYSAGIVVLRAAVVPVMLWIAKLIVDAAASFLVSGDADAQHLAVLCLGAELALALVLIALDQAQTFLGIRLSTALQAKIVQAISAKASALDMERYESSEFHDGLERTTRESGERPLAIYRTVLELAQSGLTFVAVSLLVLAFSPWMALLVTAAIVPTFVARLRLARAHFELMDDLTEQSRWLGYCQHVLTSRAFASEVRLLPSRPFFLGQLDRTYAERRRAETVLAAKRARTLSAAQAGTTAAYYLAYFSVVLSVFGGSITLGAMTMLADGLRRTQNQFQGLLAASAEIYEHNLFLGRFFEFLALPATIGSDAAARAPAPASATIEVKGVSYRYPGSERDALSDLDVRIEPGEAVALVGENGAGKTTLTRLLTRLYDPTRGRILLGGRDLVTLCPAALRRMFGVATQESIRYDLTLRENLLLGNEGPRRELEAILAHTGVLEVARLLPEGLDTHLGRAFEQGTELSEGQWQRVAVARALLRDAPILIFDEPTAAMDAKQEHEFIGNLRGLTTDRTVLLISHRLSAVRVVDRIVVLERGAVVQDGSHAELESERGPYRELYRRQAAGYLPAAQRRHHHELEEGVGCTV